VQRYRSAAFPQHARRTLHAAELSAALYRCERQIDFYVEEE
jgi:hypothetical protein